MRKSGKRGYKLSFERCVACVSRVCVLVSGGDLVVTALNVELVERKMG